jgi:hypothetical protein
MTEGVDFKEIEKDIKAYVKKDDLLKEDRAATKQIRAEVKQHTAAIIAWMQSKGLEKIDLTAKQQVLLLKERDIKIRPNGDVIKAKIQELMNKGVKDPEEIFAAIQNCGGVQHVARLSRRSITRQHASNPVHKRRRVEEEESEESEEEETK